MQSFLPNFMARLDASPRNDIALIRQKNLPWMECSLAFQKVHHQLLLHSTIPPAVERSFRPTDLVQKLAWSGFPAGGSIAVRRDAGIFDHLSAAMTVKPEASRAIVYRKEMRKAAALRRISQFNTRSESLENRRRSGQYRLADEKMRGAGRR